MIYWYLLPLVIMLVSIGIEHEDFMTRGDEELGKILLFCFTPVVNIIFSLITIGYWVKFVSDRITKKSK